MRRPIHKGIAICAILCALTLPALAVAQTATPGARPTPPTQPATGPGGATYAYAEVTARHYGPEPDGTTDPVGYWLFEPAAPADAAAADPVPLIVFLHGYFGTDPAAYRSWIDHLVRHGAVVLFPDYQPLNAPLFERCPNVCSEADLPTLPHMLAAVRAALAELATGDHVAVDLARVGAVGYSWGGMLASQYAARAEAEGLPVPGALMAVTPGCICDFAAGLETVPASTRVILLVGTQDTVVGEIFARPMWAGLSAVPLDRRDYVRLASDRHGRPPLVADHNLPQTDGPMIALDAYDWYGTWKLFDALTGCNFAETDCDVALGNTPAQRFMGLWSDGVPVQEPVVTDDPDEP